MTPPRIDINKYLTSRLENYLDLLREMVAINSFSSNPAGVNHLARRTAEIFTPLGFQVELVSSQYANHGNHLFLTKQASQQINGKEEGRTNENPTLILVSHLDTVFTLEEEIANNFIWRHQGDRIYGPGTIDIKGGTVMIFMVLDALHSIYPKVFESIHWVIGLDASEETLSDDFNRCLLERAPQSSLACLIFEGGTLEEEVFPLVVARKGRASFKVTVEGKSAHAGNHHHKGANAIVQLAHTIQQIASFTDYTKQITFNVGVVQGGSVVNRVPHYAEAIVEMRTFDPGVFQLGLHKMLALDGSSQVSSQDGYPCRVSVKLTGQTDPWPHDSKTDRLYDIWHSVAANLGWQISPEERGGLSDGNLLWQHWPTLDGLGPTGNNAHCSECSPDSGKDQEYVLVSSFVPKALININAILKLLQA